MFVGTKQKALFHEIKRIFGPLKFFKIFLKFLQFPTFVEVAAHHKLIFPNLIT